MDIHVHGHDRWNMFWGINVGLVRERCTAPQRHLLAEACRNQCQGRISPDLPFLKGRKIDEKEPVHTFLWKHSLHFGMWLVSFIHRVVRRVLLISILSYFFLIVTYKAAHALPAQKSPVLKWNFKSWENGSSCFCTVHAEWEPRIRDLQRVVALSRA